MATFRRARTPGATYFFTLVAYRRRTVLTDPLAIDALRDGVRTVRREHPFEIVAFVVLPDHLHAIWTLPEGDDDYSRRWALIKRHVGRRSAERVADALPRSLRLRNESGFWQRRFWEHQIRDEADLRRHIDYVHFNPVKHGHANRVADWPYSTFHRYVRAGVLGADWGADAAAIEGEFGE